MKIKSKFLKSIAGYSFVSIATFAIGFIATPIMTRLYEPTEMGMISLFQSALSILFVIVLVGQDQALARFYFETDEKDSLLSVNVKICCLSWIMTFAVTVVFSSLISKIAFGEVNRFGIIMCSLCTLPNMAVRMSTQLYRMKNSIRAYSLLTVLTNTVTKIGVIGIAFIDPSANAWVIAYVALYYIIGAVSVSVLMRKYRIHLSMKSHRKQTTEMLRFGFPLLFSSFTYLLIAWFPKSILADAMGTHEVGIYASAVSLASAINLVESGLNSYFAVYFYENYKKDKGEVNVIHHGLVFISVVAMIGMTLCGPIIVLLLGEKYRLALNSFPFIVCAHVFSAASETTVHGIDIAKKTYWHIIISILSAISSGIVTYLLAPNYGSVGASIGYCCGIIVFFLLRTVLGLREIKIVKDLWVTAIGTGVMIACAVINTLSLGYLKQFLVTGALLVGIIVMYLIYFVRNKSLLKEVLKNE